MTTLDHDLQQEARHIDDLKRRAQRRLAECREQTNSLKAQGAEAAAAGDTKGPRPSNGGPRSSRP